MTDNSALVIWRFIDGKPGHENQTQGLIQALSKKADVKVFDVKPEPVFQAFRFCTKKSFPLQGRLSPALIMGAGHATHLSVLAASRTFRAKSVILMKPSWPVSLFDFCIVPEHDGLPASERIITTTGVLNRILPSTQLDENTGLILIGGPSSHYEWHNTAMLQRIQLILEKDKKQWKLTTSRRTPDAFLEKLKQLSLDNLQIIPVSETDAYWLPQQLQRAGTVWISEDSVSMVYEALTAGASCGILPVQRKQDSRVSAGIDKLIEGHMLVSFEGYMASEKMLTNEKPINEAQRVADYLLKHV
ncbi:MAG: hypothetical protein GXP13_01070 [Gammaproteobacteria bacterium]|nr:hypothetical protein [Gammaproteobacteria bacterium]